MSKETTTTFHALTGTFNLQSSANMPGFWKRVKGSDQTLTCEVRKALNTPTMQLWYVDPKSNAEYKLSYAKSPDNSLFKSVQTLNAGDVIDATIVVVEPNDKVTDEDIAQLLRNFPDANLSAFNKARKNPSESQVIRFEGYADVE